MENIAAELGSFTCRIATNFAGYGQATCYNVSSAATIGYGIILGLGLLVAFRRIFSQAG